MLTIYKVIINNNVIITGYARGLDSNVPNAPNACPNRFPASEIAPKLDVVRIGFIGLGNRGSGAITRVNRIEGVQTTAICDVRVEKAQAGAKALKKMNIEPVIYTEKEDAWKEMCQRDDIDLVYICTPWDLHTPMAVYAMKQGKHVAIEVPAATTLEECWQLVETSEKTKNHCMMLENCCYDFFE
jgi:predicted dehydrogenase